MRRPDRRAATGVTEALVTRERNPRGGEGVEIVEVDVGVDNEGSLTHEKHDVREQLPERGDLRCKTLPSSTRSRQTPVSYTHLRAHETVLDLVCRLLLEKNK